MGHFQHASLLGGPVLRGRGPHHRNRHFNLVINRMSRNNVRLLIRLTSLYTRLRTRLNVGIERQFVRWGRTHFTRGHPPRHRALTLPTKGHTQLTFRMLARTRGLHHPIRPLVGRLFNSFLRLRTGHRIIMGHRVQVRHMILRRRHCVTYFN